MELIVLCSAVLVQSSHLSRFVQLEVGTHKVLTSLLARTPTWLNIHETEKEAA